MLRNATGGGGMVVRCQNCGVAAAAVVVAAGGGEVFDERLAIMSEWDMRRLSSASSVGLRGAAANGSSAAAAAAP